MTDSEHSDAEVSYTDNGTFNLSRGQTPLTEGSEGRLNGRRGVTFTPSSCFSPRLHVYSGQILIDTVMPRNPSLKTSQTSPP